MGSMLAGLYVKSTLEEGQLFTISRRKLAPGGSVCPLPARPPRCQSIKKIAKLEKVKKKKMVNTLSELGSACLSGELEKERGKVFVLWKRRSNKALSSSQALIRPSDSSGRGQRQSAPAEAAGETEAPRGPGPLLSACHGLAAHSQRDPGYRPTLPKPEIRPASASWFWSLDQNARVQFLSLLLVSLVTLSNSLNPSVLTFPHV